MEIKINIYGKDYSEIDFESYDNSKRTGIESFSYDYIGKEICKIIVLKFLEKLDTKYKRFVQMNESRTTEKSYVLYEEAYKKLRFGNIVGVLIQSNFTLKKEDLLEYYLDDSSILKITKNHYKIKLQISSRFDGQNTYFLPTLLHHTEFQVSEQKDLELVPSSTDEVFDFLLIYLFKHQLKEAYILGPYRKYTHFQNNDFNLKGKINFSEHIKLNIGQNNGKIAYDYRKNTTDNTLNYLIIHAYKNILKFYPKLGEKLLQQDQEFIKIINELMVLVENINSANIGQIINSSSNSIIHPYYYLYDKVRVTSLMLIRHLKISMFDSNQDDEVQGILFYVPDLWESYLEDMMKEKIDLKSQKEERVYGLNHKTYPDFLIMYKQKPIMILDAKYKIGWTKFYRQKNCELADYTKCIRDMNTINAHATGVIFPMQYKKETEKIIFEKDFMIHKISEWNKYDTFYSIPVAVPTTDGKEYTFWKKEYDSYVNNALDFIVNFVDIEKKRTDDLIFILNKVDNTSVLEEHEKEVLRKILN